MSQTSGTRYFCGGDGSLQMVCGLTDPTPLLDDGWTEITADEYEQAEATIIEGLS